MPTKNSTFSIKSTTIKPVFPTVGVLMSAQGTDEQAEVSTFVGAYYETDEEFQGLYIAKPDGSLDYFDIEIEDIVAQGTDQLIRFDSEGKNYLLRTLYTEDGGFISKYKIDLPKSALEKKIILESKPAIEKLTGVDLGDEEVPFFEGLYCYYLVDSPVIMSIVYMSSAGIFARRNGEWKPESLNPDIYESIPVFEISEDGAKELLNQFDTNNNKLPTEDAKKLSVDPE